MIRAGSTWKTDRIDEIAARSIELGIRRLIHLDLARVGVGRDERARRQ